MDATELIAIAAIVFPSGLTIYMALSRQAHKAERDGVDNKLISLTQLSHAQQEKLDHLQQELHDNDKATIKLQGDLRLAEQRNDTVVRDIEEIRSKMVTREMWNETNKKLDQLLGSTSRGRYGGGSGSGDYPQTPPRK